MSLGCRCACAWTAVNLETAKRAATKAANANLPDINGSADDGRSVSCSVGYLMESFYEWCCILVRAASCIMVTASGFIDFVAKLMVELILRTR